MPASWWAKRHPELRIEAIFWRVLTNRSWTLFFRKNRYPWPMPTKYTISKVCISSHAPFNLLFCRIWTLEPSKIKRCFEVDVDKWGDLRVTSFVLGALLELPDVLNLLLLEWMCPYCSSTCILFGKSCTGNQRYRCQAINELIQKRTNTPAVIKVQMELWFVF